MKILLLLLPAILSATFSFAQRKDVADRPDWTIQKAEQGEAMVMDIPYQRDHADSTEQLRLTVAKTKTRLRPDFISVTVPDNIVQANGVFVAFANDLTEGKQKIKLEQAPPVRVPFEQCQGGTCIARMTDGFAALENGKQEDIFLKFLLFDRALFLLVYPDGSHKSIMVPLSTFRDQFKKGQ